MYGGNSSESRTKVIQSEDGTYSLVGETRSTDIEGTPTSSPSWSNIYLAKLTNDLNLEWQIQFGTPGWNQVAGLTKFSSLYYIYAYTDVAYSAPPGFQEWEIQTFVLADKQTNCRASDGRQYGDFNNDGCTDLADFLFYVDNKGLDVNCEQMDFK